MATKRLFEVSVRNRHEPEPPSKVLIVLADDEDDLQLVGGIGDATIVDVVEIDSHVAAAGPSRVIGWTRRAAPALALS